MAAAPRRRAVRLACRAAGAHPWLGKLLPVAHPSEVEARLAALEARIEEVAADAAAPATSLPPETATSPTSA